MNQPRIEAARIIARALAGDIPAAIAPRRDDRGDGLRYRRNQRERRRDERRTGRR